MSINERRINKNKNENRRKKKENYKKCKREKKYVGSVDIKAKS